MSVLESIAAQLETRKAKALQEYRKLVATIASDGKTPAVDKIEATLRDSGKSLEMLGMDVETAKKRNAARATIAKAEQLEAGKADLLAKVAALKAELQAAQDAHDQKLRPIQWELDSIGQAHHEREQAERILRDTTPEHVDQEITSLRDQITQASELAKQAARHLAEMKSRTPDPVNGTPSDHIEHKEAVSRAEAHLATVQAECQALVEQQDALLAESMAE